MEEDPKEVAVRKLTTDQKSVSGRLSEWRVGKKSVHVLYSSGVKDKEGLYRFRINVKSIRADAELLICGTPSVYFLLPQATVKKIYSHPTARRCSTYHDMRILIVDAEKQTVAYTTDGQTLSLEAFKNLTLD